MHSHVFLCAVVKVPSLLIFPLLSANLLVREEIAKLKRDQGIQ